MAQRDVATLDHALQATATPPGPPFDDGSNPDRLATTLARAVLPDKLLRRPSPGEVVRLPPFLDALRAVERRTGRAFERWPVHHQEALVARRLQQQVEVCRSNPLWRERIDAAIGSAPTDTLAAFEAITPTDKETARLFYTGDRPGMVVPIAHGGFQVATSGGTASGQPTEIVYPLDELRDTYHWAGAFIGHHIVERHMLGQDARWIACTLVDHMMWSSASMVGGVLQKIPGTNYIGAGAIDPKVFGRILAYPGSKAIMGISRSVADLVTFAEHVPAEHRATLRIALYGSGALQPKVHADLRAAYPNLVVLSFFAAMQAETIGLQLDPASPVLTAIPGLHHIEIVDPQNRAVAVGEEGDLLVTRLHGNGAPVLRYRLGDRMVRRPDLVSDTLHAQQFEYVGRSGDSFALGSQRFTASRVVAAIVKTLRERGLIALDRVADDIQLRLDHRTRSLVVVAATSHADDLAESFDPQAAADAIRAAFAPTAADGLTASGFDFQLALVRPGSPRLTTTEVGKTPLFVELR